MLVPTLLPPALTDVSLPLESPERCEWREFALEFNEAEGEIGDWGDGRGSEDWGMRMEVDGDVLLGTAAVG